MTSHILSILVENKPGVLARIAGLFARRGFNIDSLAVGEAEQPSLSRMTVVVSVDDKPLEQITKQLHKLINVLRITELSHEEAVERELVLLKVGVGAGRRAEVLEMAEVFRAKVVDVDKDGLVLEVTGSPEKVTALENLLKPYGIVEVARTGRVALGRGGRGLKAPSLRPVPVAQR
jgi:acetolactate synthase-1/3 small subunit